MSDATVTLHPATVSAINSEMARYEQREIRLLLEISNLHKAIGGMRRNCEDALKDCCHSGSIQAHALRRAIEIADSTISHEAVARYEAEKAARR